MAGCNYSHRRRPDDNGLADSPDECDFESQNFLVALVPAPVAGSGMALGTIFILTPTVGWAMPLVWPLVLTVAGALGYKQLTSTADGAALRGELNRELNSLKTVTLNLDQVVKDMVADEVGREQVLRFQKGDIVVVFKRNLRGKFTIEVSGPDTMTTRQLEHAGHEFAGTLVQQFAYNKMAAEMERRGANIIGEEVNENGDIVLKLRRWD
jgi:hypothetical protein